MWKRATLAKRPNKAAQVRREERLARRAAAGYPKREPVEGLKGTGMALSIDPLFAPMLTFLRGRR